MQKYLDRIPVARQGRWRLNFLFFINGDGNIAGDLSVSTLAEHEYATQLPLKPPTTYVCRRHDRIAPFKNSSATGWKLKCDILRSAQIDRKWLAVINHGQEQWTYTCQDRLFPLWLALNYVTGFCFPTCGRDFFYFACCIYARGTHLILSVNNNWRKFLLAVHLVWHMKQRKCSEKF